MGRSSLYCRRRISVFSVFDVRRFWECCSCCLVLLLLSHQPPLLEVVQVGSHTEGPENMGCRLSVQRIPTELAIRILLCLSLDDIQSASRASRLLRDAVKGSSLLQRHALLDDLAYVECKVDACKSLLLSDKVAALRRHRQMWHSCQFLLSRSRSSVLHKEIKFAVHDYDRRFTQGLYILHQTEATEGDSRAIHIFSSHETMRL